MRSNRVIAVVPAMKSPITRSISSRSKNLENEKVDDANTIAGVESGEYAFPPWPWKLHVKKIYRVTEKMDFWDASAEDALEILEERKEE